MPSNGALTYRRLIPRRHWPAAHDVLSTAGVAFTGDATDTGVIIRTTEAGAKVLGRLGRVPPAGVRARVALDPKVARPSEPTLEWRRADPLEAAFSRMQREAKARAREADVAVAEALS